MRKSKGVSTLKGSRLQAFKDVRSKKGRGNQTNKGQTPAQRNIGISHARLSPNLSCILRNSESQGDDEHDEYYGNPLHSTAVCSGELELNDEGNEKGEERPAQSNEQGKPTQQSVPLGEKIGTEKCALTCISEGVEEEESEVNTESAEDETPDENAMEPVKKAASKRVKLRTASSSQSSKASKRAKAIPSRTGAAKSPSDGNSGMKRRAVSADATKKSLGKTRAQKKQSSKRAGAPAAHSRGSSFHAGSHTETSLQNNLKSYGWKRKKTLVSRTSESSTSPNSSASSPAAEAGPSSVKIRCPEGVKRLKKDVTELDVVLDDFEEIVTEYKQSVETNVCRKVIDRFFTDLKEQVTETISQVQDLKDVERKNAKVLTTFNKTRKHFLVAQKELNEQEVQLKHLQKEYSEMSQKNSDLQLATQFVSGFKQLKTQYIEHRNKNPHEKETYDISSFPALLIEARGILGAEKQLQIINTKLQQSLDKN